MTMAALFGLLAAFGVFLAVQGLVRRSAPQADLLEARLAQFTQSGHLVTSLTEAELSLPFFERVFRPTFNKWGSRLAARTPAARQQALQEKIIMAGRPWGITVGGFLALRLFSLLTLAAAGWGVGALLGLSGVKALLTPVVGAVLGYLLPQSALSRRIRKRQKEILLGLPSALDLLTISVEAGLGFDAALARVCEKYKNALAAEFSQVLNEVRLGRPRLEALDDMGKRNKVEELNNFVQAVIQSEQLGVGIANVLRIQSEEIRRRRRQRAEEAGQKAPLKMLFPMVGCIFPTLFIVLLGPAVLQVAHSIAK
ncbi:MAG TPA: type II secretion system F family protein [Candidatus Sulfotelmatobacter sp.]|jgi:tight adherence protein C|nr:type II secretion system F family protein [Candidatus Sulfotelmatobacter sp.]